MGEAKKRDITGADDKPAKKAGKKAAAGENGALPCCCSLGEAGEQQGRLVVSPACKLCCCSLLAVIRD